VYEKNYNKFLDVFYYYYYYFSFFFFLPFYFMGVAPYSAASIRHTMSRVGNVQAKVCMYACVYSGSGKMRF